MVPPPSHGQWGGGDDGGGGTPPTGGGGSNPPVASGRPSNEPLSVTNTLIDLFTASFIVNAFKSFFGGLSFLRNLFPTRTRAL